jgi:type I restriction enzyme, S subunit
LLLKNYNFDALGNTSSIATAVNSKSIKSIKVLVPNNEVLGKFSIIVDNVFQKIKNGSFENNNLSEIRDLLLPRLMSGEIEV